MAKKSEPKIIPIGDRILVRRDAGEKLTPGGLILPEQSIHKQFRGVVLAVGPSVDVEKNGKIAEGDVVLFGAYAGSELQGYEDILVMRAEDLLARVVNG